jgi:signal transduction histidine kinase
MSNAPEQYAEIDTLNQQAWKLRVSDSTQAYALSQKALQLSKAIEYDQGKAESLRTFGFCHIRLAQYQEALTLLQEAFELFVQLGDLQNQAVIHEYYGIIHRSSGDYAASLAELFKALELSRSMGFAEEETLSLYHLSITYKYLGDLNHALEHAMAGLFVARKMGEIMPESYHLNCIGGIYFEMGRYAEARNYYQQSLQLRQTLGDLWGIAGCLDNIGNIHLQREEYAQALDYCLQSLAITQKTGDKKGLGNTLFNAGKIYAELQDYSNAQDCFKQSLVLREALGDKKGRTEIYYALGSLYANPSFPEQQLSKALEYLHDALSLVEEIKANDLLYKIHFALSKVYKRLPDLAQALFHYEKFAEIEKEVNSEAVQQEILKLQINHQVAQSQKEAEIFRLKNVELAQLVEEVNQQKEEVEKAYTHLQATQAQLIQSEKLASLGELTAGIAHEIQNPLNFVINFSEISIELTSELKEEMFNPQLDQKLIEELATSLALNLEKIQRHGQRASAIVKNMLEHSRMSTSRDAMHGVSTDINALVDEYLRLAYHGWRAKDSRDAMHGVFTMPKIETHFDPDLPLVSVIPQDIGRVLLNLVNNAFYAVAERSRSAVQQRATTVETLHATSVHATSVHATSVPHAQETLHATSLPYHPTVTISTKRLDNAIEISIQDNGNGIPESIRDKIFQPFFTTKPTGQGTGLGLSLAYDIVTKGHGGSLGVESTPELGSTFVLILPNSLL